jgi:hypothetical protein
VLIHAPGENRAEGIGESFAPGGPLKPEKSVSLQARVLILEEGAARRLLASLVL